MKSFQQEQYFLQMEVLPHILVKLASHTLNPLISESFPGYKFSTFKYFDRSLGVPKSIKTSYQKCWVSCCNKGSMGSSYFKFFQVRKYLEDAYQSKNHQLTLKMDFHRSSVFIFIDFFKKNTHIVINCSF